MGYLNKQRSHSAMEAANIIVSSKKYRYNFLVEKQRTIVIKSKDLNYKLKKKTGTSIFIKHFKLNYQHKFIV